MKQWITLVAATAMVSGLAWAGKAISPDVKAPVAEQPPVKAVIASQRPRIECVFVLDSTGSMSGLIEGAKQKIWSIANEMVHGTPSPELRVGLVSYRDRGDEYVTRRFDLTDDLDKVYGNLRSFKADGGGDGPESVNEAIQEAVAKMNWTERDGVYRVIFLVGDYPPHMDYANDVKYTQSCKEAAKRGIIINTIQCGSESTCTPVWQEIAKMSEGQYVQLSQTGDMVAIATPYDAKMAELNKELGSTVVAYGDDSRKSEVAGKVRVAAEAAPAAVSDRAAYNLKSGGKAVQGSGDLVADIAEKRVDLAKVEKKQLPEEMQKMSDAERAKFVSDQTTRRDGINKQLADVARQREDYIRAEKAKATTQPGNSFDAAVESIVREQAAKRLER